MVTPEQLYSRYRTEIANLVLDTEKMRPTNAHVLIVDDEEGLADTYKEALEASGYSCLTALGGEAALEVLATEAIDLALVDIMMPGMSGLTLFHHVKELYPDVATIFVTAVDDHRAVVDNLKEGAFDYLVKPVTLRQLRQSVQEALRKRRGLLAEKEQRRLLEQQITYQARQMEAQERLRTLGQMVGGIAHDLNNALAPILGFTELLLHRPDYMDDKVKLGHYLERLHTSAEDATNVVKRLREFHRHREEGAFFTPVSINQMVEEVIGLTEPKWKHQALAENVSIQIEPSLGDISQVAGSAADLRQMLTI